MRRNELHQVPLAKVNMGVEGCRDRDKVDGGGRHGCKCSREEAAGRVHAMVGEKMKDLQRKKGRKRVSIRAAPPLSGHPLQALAVV
jgi:hypothetical protein